MNFEYIKSSIKISAMAFFVLCGSLSFQNCGGNFDTLKSSSALQSVAPIFSSGSPLHLNEIANQNSGDSSISAPALGSTISISTSSRLAGAIGSLTWNGKEFINQDDHGRELQSASAFDGLGECFNPTEAGSLADNATSTSILIGLEAVGNNLQTTSQMAFWTPVNYSYPSGCGGNPNITVAQNRSNLSNDLLTKKVSIGYAGLSNVIEYLVDFKVSEDHKSATFEALTGYMGTDFKNAWTFDPTHKSLQAISFNNLSPEQNLPIILSTEDQQYAMGIYSPDLPQANFPDAGYGRFELSVYNTMKWNAVFRRGDTPAGDYSFRLYVVVGRLSDVSSGMLATYQAFSPISPPILITPPVGTVPPIPTSPPALAQIYRFYNVMTGEHFFTASKFEGLNAGFLFESEAFKFLASKDANSIPIYRCYTNRHFISLIASCEGATLEGQYGWIYTVPPAGSSPLYRFFNPANGDHLETTNYYEGINARYNFEVVLGYVY